MSPWAFNRFSHAVSRGAVFGYPTDTIWGFGCHPLIAQSVMRILRIKQRPVDKGVILLSSRLEYCRAYIDASPDLLESIQNPIEPPTTWLLPASERCPVWLRGANPTIAVRITRHPLMQLLCDRLESPVVSTSANRAGAAPARNTIQMHRQFAAELDFIVSGFAAGSGRPSEIKSPLSGETLRSNA